MRQVARVRPLMHDDARILAQFPGKLPAPDIDRMDPRRTLRQQHVGETAGRGADIERDHAARVDREMIERKSQLDATARHPRMVAPGKRQFGVFGKRRAGFVDAPPAGGD